MNKLKMLLLSTTLVSLMSGCALLGPDAKSSVKVLECEVKVLSPYIGDLALQVVAQLESGQPVDVVQLLASLGVELSEIQKITAAYNSCRPANPVAVTPEQAKALSISKK